MEGLAQDDQVQPVLDSVDAALESFMQEDALLDAIQSAPEHTRVEPFEVEAPPPTAAPATPAVATGTTSSGVPSSGGNTAAAASLARLTEPVGSSGLQERRTEATVASEPQRHTGARHTEAKPSGDTEMGDKAKKAAKPGLPWRGALLVMMAIIGMLLVGPDLFAEEEVKIPRPPRVEPKPIQLPAVGKDEGATIPGNDTKALQVGQRLGSIGVSWSSGNVTNSSLIIAASGNSSATDTRGDHGHRQRMRGKSGNSALH